MNIREFLKEMSGSVPYAQRKVKGMEERQRVAGYLLQDMGYSEGEGAVTLTMSMSDYESILLALGMATGLASKEDGDIGPWISLVNRINQGNPHFVPYREDK